MGRPHNGAVAEIRRSTRATYHRAIRTVYKNEKTLINENIAVAFLDKSDNRHFGQRLRSLDVKVGMLSINAIGNPEIANLFGTKCRNLYNSVISSESELEAIHDILRHESSYMSPSSSFLVTNIDMQ